MLEKTEMSLAYRLKPKHITSRTASYHCVILSFLLLLICFVLYISREFPVLYFCFLFTALNSLYCAEVLLRNCSFTHLPLTETSAAENHMKVTKVFADRPKPGALSSYS